VEYTDRPRRYNPRARREFRSLALKILHRYILKEHLGPLLFSLGTLTSLLLLNYVAKQFGNLVGKGLPWTVIAEFFVLSIPFTVAMTFPMAVLVATLYAFSRLAAENEITALKASGVGMLQLLVPALIGACGIAALMIAFNDQLLPRANHQLRTLQSDIARKKPTFALREQVINEVSPGQIFLRAGHLDEGSSRMREVTIYDLSDPTRRRTIYADSGTMGLASNRRDLLMTLYNGSMLEIQKATPEQLQRLFYTVDHLRVKGVANQFDRDSTDNYKSDREMSICEMQTVYANAVREEALSRHQLADVFGRAVREAATGVAVARPPAPPPPAFNGLGGLYCRALDAVFSRPPPRPPEPDADIAPHDVAPAVPVRVVPVRVVPPPTPPPASGAKTPAGTERRPFLPKTTATATPAVRVAPPAGASALPRAPARAAPQIPRGGPAGGVATAGPRLTPGPGLAAVMPLTSIGAELDAARAHILDSEQTRDAYDVEIQKKFALAAACIVFVLLGAPIALRFPRGGVGLTIGVSLGVFGLYYVGLIGGEELGNRDILSPFWSMWAANALFTAIGLFFLARMGRESGTTRGGDFREVLLSVRNALARPWRRGGGAGGAEFRA
jgi:lipopolysaccharide export system permease protein